MNKNKVIIIIKNGKPIIIADEFVNLEVIDLDENVGEVEDILDLIEV